ncbi:MAG: hypothetical protein RLO50_09345 [Azospirillaceae bacterium]
MNGKAQTGQKRGRRHPRPGLSVARALFELSLLSFVMLPFARPQAMAWVESGTGEWFLADSLQGNLCLPGGGLPDSGSAGGNALCGLCVMPAGGLGLAGQAGSVPQPIGATTAEVTCFLANPVAPADDARNRPPARAPPILRAA